MTDDISEFDAEMRRLEKEIKIEEIRKLQASRKFLWVNPAALGIILPLIGALGLWVVSEVKGYSAAYRAVAEVEKLRDQSRDLSAQKDSLNLEIMALLTLKAHYALEAERLDNLLAQKQDIVDHMYLRSRWAVGESLYALDHAQQGWSDISADGFDGLTDKVAALNTALGAEMMEYSDKFRMFEEMSTVSDAVLNDFLKSLDSISPSPEALTLQWRPEGSVLNGLQVMVEQGTSGGYSRYYDVKLGRFLTEAEVAQVE